MSTRDFSEKRSKPNELLVRRHQSSEESNSLVIQGRNELNDIVALTADYDLLIMGALPPQSIIDTMFGSKQDKITAKSACSVLRIQTSGL